MYQNIIEIMHFKKYVQYDTDKLVVINSFFLNWMLKPKLKLEHLPHVWMHSVIIV